MAYYENDPRHNGTSQDDRYERAYQQYQQSRTNVAGYADSPFLSLSQYMARNFG